MRTLASTTRNTEKAPAHRFSRDHSRGVPERDNTSPVPFFSEHMIQRKAYCACGGGCPNCQSRLPIQAKLKIGAPDDKYEQEADRVAEQVMTMREPKVQRQIEEDEEDVLQTKPIAEKITPLVQRQVEPEIEEEEEEPVSALQAAPDEMDEVAQAKHGSHDTVSGKLASLTNNLRTGGKPLPQSERAFFERRFGADFSDVNLHTDKDAVHFSKKLNAHAFTKGKDIYFNDGCYNPETQSGRLLLSHELTHVIQQRKNSTLTNTLQRNGPDTETTTEKEVVVIGSPSPAEIRANHPYQFVNAARCAGVDENTVWMVERTGYEAGNVDLDPIRGYISGGQLIWITPSSNLVRALNSFEPGSINEFKVFSHGTAGQVALRYGWSGSNLPNYGLSIPEIRQMNRNLFTDDAQISFDSCNAGTADFAGSGGNTAQQFAEQSGRSVGAWTGRTSYSEVNAAGGEGACRVVDSQMFRGGRPDTTEMLSQLALGRDPQRTVFRPISGTMTDSFNSYFEIRRRLPESRTFTVPQNGSVAVTCPDPHLVINDEDAQLLTRRSEYTDYGTAQESVEDYERRVQLISGRFWVNLTLDDGGFFSDPSIGIHHFPVAQNNERAVWTGLDAGTYYVEVYRLGGNSNFPIRSSIRVEIYSP